MKPSHNEPPHAQRRGNRWGRESKRTDVTLSLRQSGKLYILAASIDSEVVRQSLPFIKADHKMALE
mgnify:CR=1 FL=1